MNGKHNGLTKHEQMVLRALIELGQSEAFSVFRKLQESGVRFSANHVRNLLEHLSKEGYVISEDRVVDGALSERTYKAQEEQLLAVS